MRQNYRFTPRTDFSGTPPLNRTPSYNPPSTLAIPGNVSLPTKKSEQTSYDNDNEPSSYTKAQLLPIDTLSNEQIHIIRLILFFVLLRMLIQQNKEAGVDVSKFSLDIVVKDIIGSPSAAEILDAIAPYFDGPQQKNIYTFLGMLEAQNVIKGLTDGSYQRYRMLNGPLILEDNKTLGMLKAVKPFIREEQQPFIDSIIKAQTVSDRLAKNIEVYQKNKILEDTAYNPLDTVQELVKVFLPIIPDQEQKRVDKLITMINLMQSMDMEESDEENVPDNDKLDDDTLSNQDEPQDDSNDMMEIIAKMAQILSQNPEK